MRILLVCSYDDNRHSPVGWKIPSIGEVLSEALVITLRSGVGFNVTINDGGGTRPEFKGEILQDWWAKARESTK